MLINRLAILLAERKMSGARLFAETGIAQSTISKITSNKSKQIDYETVNKICNALGVTPADFFDYSPIEYEITIEAGEKEDFTVFVKLSYKNRHVTTLEYTSRLEFFTNKHHPWFFTEGIPIEEIKKDPSHTSSIDIEVYLTLKENVKAEDLFPLPTHFQTIFNDELASKVFDHITNFVDYSLGDSLAIRSCISQMFQLKNRFDFDINYLVLPTEEVSPNDIGKIAKKSLTAILD